MQFLVFERSSLGTHTHIMLALTFVGKENKRFVFNWFVCDNKKINNCWSPRIRRNETNCDAQSHVFMTNMLVATIFCAQPLNTCTNTSQHTSNKYFRHTSKSRVPTRTTHPSFFASCLFWSYFFLACTLSQCRGFLPGKSLFLPFVSGGKKQGRRNNTHTPLLETLFPFPTFSLCCRQIHHNHTAHILPSTHTHTHERKIFCVFRGNFAMETGSSTTPSPAYL